MSGVTSLAVLPVTVEHGEDSPGLRVTGGRKVRRVTAVNPGYMRYHPRGVGNDR